MTEKMKRFSERMGITKPRRFQLNEMGLELRNALWSSVLEQMGGRPTSSLNDLKWLTDKIVFWFFKIPLDEVYGLKNWNERKDWIKKRFYGLRWNEVYDFIEFLTPYITRTKRDLKDFQELLNNALESENSAYRFTNGWFVPITNKQEIKEIEEAIERADKVGIDGAREHLSSALSLLVRKPEPDYRNSIKESISAVASLAAILSGKGKDDFAPALEELSKKIPIHGALKQGLIKIYGYASDEDGIRHAMLENPNIEFDDEAKFMLVSCSAFTNYLISKAQKAELLKEG